MARFEIYGLNNKREGEVNANFDRGWMIAGHPDVVGGGDTEITLEEDQANRSYLQFGRMALITHPRLPNWAGMIDAPWSGALPVKMKIYNAEWLLSLRSPDEPTTIEGSVSSIAARMLEMVNAVEDLFVRLGETSLADSTTRIFPIDQRNFWEHFQDLMTRSNCEMITRAELDTEGRLIIYLDIARRVGVDTGFLYFDGRGGNASFSEPVMDGPIINRVIGVNDGSGPETRLKTPPILDETSAQRYRIRTETVQFRGVREQSTLELYARNYLAATASPRFSFFVQVEDKGEAFQNARLGNIIRAHIANVRLPGGVKGYDGRARILAMSYVEANNTLGLKVGLI